VGKGRMRSKFRLYESDVLIDKAASTTVDSIDQLKVAFKLKLKYNLNKVLTTKDQ